MTRRKKLNFSAMNAVILDVLTERPAMKMSAEKVFYKTVLTMYVYHRMPKKATVFLRL